MVIHKKKKFVLKVKKYELNVLKFGLIKLFDLMPGYLFGRIRIS